MNLKKCFDLIGYGTTVWVMIFTLGYLSILMYDKSLIMYENYRLITGIEIVLVIISIVYNIKGFKNLKEEHQNENKEVFQNEKEFDFNFSLFVFNSNG